MNKIEIITTQTDLMIHYDLMKKIPYVDTTPETMLAKCLLGEYKAFSFIEDDESVGIVILRDLKPLIFVVGISLEGKSKAFYDQFYAMFKEIGYTHMQAASKMPTERFEGFSGFKKTYSYYEKEL